MQTYNFKTPTPKAVNIELEKSPELEAVNIELEKSPWLETVEFLVIRTAKDLLNISIIPSWYKPSKKDISALDMITGDNLLVLGINHPGAYGHVYNECLAELYSVENTYPHHTTIVTASTPKLREIVDFFKLKMSKRLKYIAENQVDRPVRLKFKNLKIVQHAPNAYTNKLENLKRLKNAMHLARPITQKDKNFLIYCSRQSANARHGRKITDENETVVVKLLKAYAVKHNLTFYMFYGIASDNSSDMSIAEQYELFSNAKIVVGLHGGAMANVIFLDPLKNSKVIEFCPTPGKNFDRLFGGFISTFTQYISLPYILPDHLKNKSFPDIIEELRYEDCVINLKTLQMALDHG